MAAFSLRHFTPCMLFVLAACGEQAPPAEQMADDGDETPAYVGSETCAGCHEVQARLWSGSHHDQAMQLPAAETVLGDFGDSRFRHQGVETRFRQRDGQYFVTTDDANGELREFPVRYTFGVSPLQQYLLEMPGGKLQALSVAWDSRPAEDGGQRWFHTYGDEPIDHTDLLHWTRSSQNWETMCADCHSTDLVKRYDVAADSFETRYAEIDVGCEACHGPGSRHLDWAENPDADPARGLELVLDERDGVSWTLDPATGNSRRSQPRASSREINTCAACHSRRARIGPATWSGGEFLDSYQPALIEPPLYHVDGQVNEEVYVYGSFLQSRMYQRGVTCSDCHEPHSLQLRAPGTQVCLQCHAADRFATTEHQLHAPASAGANCIECHMPARRFMQIDNRHDHSFRIPRPEISAEFGTPLVCASCHADADPGWAEEVLAAAGALRADTAEHWSRRLAAANTLPLQARNLNLGLAADALVPNIVRASAMAGLDLSGDSLGATVVGEQLQSRDPLLRLGAAMAMQTAAPAARVQFGPRILNDPVRAVRQAGVMVLAPLGPEAIPPESQKQFFSVVQEYRDAQLANAERAPSHVNLGNLSRHLGRSEDAVRDYRTAIRVNPDFVPAYVNLADMYRELGDEKQAEAVLRDGLQRQPANPVMQYALGLAMVRQGRAADAYELLREAAESEDATPRFALAYAMIMDAQGQGPAAVAYLESALQRFKDDPALTAALANFYQRSGDMEQAVELGGRLPR